MLNQFNFGLELEFLLADKNSWKPLWYQDLSFSRLNQCFEGIKLDDFPSLAGLDLEPPHNKLMPFVVEGYHVPDEYFNMIDILPKGVEIRSPVLQSIDDCLNVTKSLYDCMSFALDEIGCRPIALSHHPIYSKFSGKQNKRRHDYWLWALEVMTTYGPDINISLPDEVFKKIDIADLEAKINYYAPAMAAFSVASPFLEGDLWKIRGCIGKSFRTYRRSTIAPPIEFHPDEGNRLEFKVFEMSPNLEDYKNYFLLFLEILLDDNLKGRASAQTRIYDLGSVAQFGFEAPEVRKRAAQILQKAYTKLPTWGFPAETLNTFGLRLEKNQTPADLMIEEYQQTKNLMPILKKLSCLE
jgi:carboxylate-amine ligase